MAMSHDASVRLGTLGWALVAIAFLIGTPLLWAASPLLLFGVALVGALLGLVVHGLRRFFLRRLGGGSILRAMLMGSGLVTGVVAAPGWWLILQPGLHPLAVPQVTLTDGTRQVVFQGMTHVASEGFYKSVSYDLMRAKDAGYVLFFEGVKPGTPEADAWLEAATQSGGDLNAQYGKIGAACGLSFQGDFLAFVQRDQALDPQHLVAADVSVTEMYEEWQRQVAADPALADAVPPPSDSTSSLATLLELATGLTGSQKDLLAAACRGAFAVVLGGAESPDALNGVILDFRNRKLADRVSALPDANIYITYGSSHFPGFLRDLLARNANWQVVGTDWTTAIGPPDDASGTLPVRSP